MWQQMICVVLLAMSPLVTPLPSEPVAFLPGDLADAESPAFTPDGHTVYFMRASESGAAVMVSHRVHDQWSAPVPASFSGHWRDGDPTMAPDGSYLVFTSNRPAMKGGQPIDTVRQGKLLTGLGMNLWRVERKGDGWSEPVRLPDTVNTCNSSFAPSVASDGSIYYIGCAPDGVIRPLRASHENGQYQPAYVVAVGGKDAQVRDVAIAPDRSFMVFSIRHDPKQAYRLAIAFHTTDNWSEPQDLGDVVNSGTHSMGSQLGCDHRTLYFSSDRALPTSAPAQGTGNTDHIWRLSLTPWLTAHGQPAASTPPSCVVG
ncbi:TolB family protein [Dyella japonica]|uniref:TolB family protein n=1 Tax=Dyella japonica TaxID=231455 RepID=UPI0002F07DED|nr:PD40 domain-containing protein [Dyella japonica]